MEANRTKIGEAILVIKAHMGLVRREGRNEKIKKDGKKSEQWQRKGRKSEKLLFNYCNIMKGWETKEKEKQESNPIDYEHRSAVKEANIEKVNR
jgi:hypothetical protein